MIEISPDKLELKPGAVEGHNDAMIAVRSAYTSPPSGRFSYRVPFFVTRAQTYFWTTEWQKGEAEAEADIERGDLRRFSDFDEALRWLDGPEDQ